MTALSCYRCGGSLATLTPPLARLDLCPACGVELHVCRMCLHYAPRAPTGCDEEDALEVRDKMRANFCDYFAPSPAAYHGAEQAAERQARTALGALFGTDAETIPGAAPSDSPSTESADGGEGGDLDAANALFKK
jgi:hypothetical protein